MNIFICDINKEMLFCFSDAPWETRAKRKMNTHSHTSYVDLLHREISNIKCLHDWNFEIVFQRNKKKHWKLATSKELCTHNLCMLACIWKYTIHDHQFTGSLVKRACLLTSFPKLSCKNGKESGILRGAPACNMHKIYWAPAQMAWQKEKHVWVDCLNLYLI